MNKKPKARTDPVEVHCRIRPMNDEEGESCLKILDDQNLMLEIPECSASFRSGQIKKLVYSFAKIFGDTTSQKEIFEKIGLPLVKDLLEGKNGLLFTYGVTGSGKTYTMIGNQQEHGLLQRCLDTVFNSISFSQAKKYTFKPDKMNSFELQSEADAQAERQRSLNIQLKSQSHNTANMMCHFNSLVPPPAPPPPPPSMSSNSASTSQTPARNTKTPHFDPRRFIEPSGNILNVIEDHKYAVFVSCVEIYNNYIYDLLDDTNASSADSARRMDNSRESKNLKEDSKSAMYIKDVAEIEVKSTEEALDLMHKALKRRVIGYTDLNSESSRSHSIFTIRVVQAAYDPSSEDQVPKPKSMVHVSQLSLVDLAGSERTKRTKNTGNRLREAGSINSSLMALRNCMETLRENILSGTRKMVPYRDSKLTLLFKNYFEGNGKIKMILCINPSQVEFDETINVLKFSDLVRDILVPMAAQQIMNKPDRVEKVSLDSLEQACLSFLNNFQQNAFIFMPESFPSLDIFSPDDPVSLNKLIEHLEEFRRKQSPFIQESESLKQQYYLRLKESNEEIEKIREERDEMKSRFESKEREQLKMDSKMKALEKVINSNNFRTPINTAPNHNKENRPMFTTPSRNNSGGSSSSTGSNAHINGIGGSVNGTGANGNTCTGNNMPFASTFTKTPITSTIRTETPITSTYRSSRITHTTATQSIGRHYGTNTIIANPPPLPPPQTPFRDHGVIVGNKRNRRSKSAEMWLDHKPPNSAKIDTVMQPKMQRKKSVSKVELSDAKKSSRYLLTHQQQDSDGEVVTNLIKGDILKSPSGGANVIFTDVETLHVRAHETPKILARKRISEELNDAIDDPQVIQERCSIAIEGHNYHRPLKPLKKIKS